MRHMRDEIKTSCLKRLKRIEGQIRGLAGMVEEVLRVYGYDRIPSRLPAATGAGVWLIRRIEGAFDAGQWPASSATPSKRNSE